MRSGREEAVLPRLSRRARLQLRACSAATFTAATARTGSRRRRCAIRTPARRRATRRPRRSSRTRCASGAKIVVSTYNEPLITAEWAVAIFKEAREHGLVTGFVSNGNGTPRVLEYLRPHIDLYKVDLKSFDDRRYRELGGRLQPILDTIQWLHANGVWVEIVTLLVPGFNDSEAELRGLTRFLAGVSVDIPWHVTAFHQDYKMTEPANTTAAMLQRAAAIAPRAPASGTSTPAICPAGSATSSTPHCHECGERLITRLRIPDSGVPADAGRGVPPVRHPHSRAAGAPPSRASAPPSRSCPHDRTRLSVACKG